MVVATIGAPRRGGRAGAGDRFGVASLGACGVLASMGRTSLVKRTIWAQGVFKGAALGAVAVAGAVGALGVSVRLHCLFDLEAAGEEEEGGLEDGNVSRSTETSTEVESLDSRESRPLLSYRAERILTSSA